MVEIIYFLHLSCFERKSASITDVHTITCSFKNVFRPNFFTMQGGSQYGQRSIMDQVGEYVRCSRQNQRMFRTPQVLFAFANGVTSGLANRIQRQVKLT